MPRERRGRWPFAVPAVGVLVVAAVTLMATFTVENLRSRGPTSSTPTTASTAAPTAASDSPGAGSRADLGPWTGANGVVAPPASPTQQTASAVSVQASAPHVQRMAAVSDAGPGSWALVSPGVTYTFSSWVMASTTPRPAEAVIGFFSAAGSALGSAWGPMIPDAAGRWTQTASVVGIAPAGASFLKLGVFFYGPDQGETHLIKSPALSSQTPRSADVSGPLHTSGRTIYEATGQPVTLRGVVSEWLNHNVSVPAGSPLDDNNVAGMKAWGANTVRVLLNENSWSPDECGYSPEYEGAVDQVVRSITSRRMVALLGLHSNSRTACGSAAQQRMADAPGSTRFWTSVAARYKDNPLVAFDLYNEPHDIPWGQWLNGGSLTDPDGVHWNAAGMRQLYDAVRGQGATNLVFLSGDDWANTPPPVADLVAGPNIVFAVHAYTCPKSAPPACNAPDPFGAPPNLSRWTSMAQGHPVVVTEFGWPDPGSGTYNENIIKWARSHDVGWTAYAWAPSGTFQPATAEFGVIADRAAAEPEPSGMPVLAALAAGR